MVIFHGTGVCLRAGVYAHARTVQSHLIDSPGSEDTFISDYCVVPRGNAHVTSHKKERTSRSTANEITSLTPGTLILEYSLKKTTPPHEDNYVDIFKLC